MSSHSYSQQTSFLICFTLVSLLASLVRSQCVFNATHCQCATTPGGGDCLSFNSRSGGSTMCDVYSCNPGLVCDCAGTEMCEFQSCPARTVYKPNQAIAGATGPVSCTEETTTNCTIIASPSPTPSVTPLTTPSATPSVTPLTTPSATPSTTPSVTPSMTPSSTPSATPSVTPSPSPVYFQANNVCLAAPANCFPGLDCQCGGYCKRPVSYTIHIVADDTFDIYTCGGTYIGSGTSLNVMYSYTYTGYCDSLFFYTTNAGGGMGTAIAIEYNGNVYASGPSWPPLVLLNGATSGWNQNLASAPYDYSSWSTGVLEPSLVGFWAYPTIKGLYGADPMGFPGANYVPGDNMFLRWDPPFC